MRIAWRMASEVRRQCAIEDWADAEDLAAVCDKLGMHWLLSVPMGAEVVTVTTRRGIVLRRGLGQRECRWLTAHCLGWWLLARQSGQIYVCTVADLARRPRSEAEAFAGWLLIGDVLAARADGDPFELAALGRVPVAWARSWWELARSSGRAAVS